MGLTSKGQAVEVPFFPTMRSSRIPMDASGEMESCAVNPPLARAADLR